MYPLFRWKKGFFFHYLKIIHAMETAFGICVYHLKFSSFGEGSGYKGYFQRAGTVCRSTLYGV
jgi:hypothetical protein